MTVVVRIDAGYELGGWYTLERLVDQSLETTRPLTVEGDTVILIGARGRPVIGPRDTIGKIRANNETLQFRPFAAALAVGLGTPADPTERRLPTIQLPAYQVAKDCFLVENLRFDEREGDNDQVLARQLAALGDRYLIDDFRSLNRTCSAMVSMPKAIPTRLSDRVVAELAVLERLRRHPKHPVVAVVGGNQVARKFRLLRGLADTVDEVLVGGVVANTLLAANGIDLRRSLVDAPQLDTAKQLVSILNHKLVLPIDFIWRGGRVMDTGPKSRARFIERLTSASTVVMTGPLGVTSLQIESFAQSTLALIDSALEVADREIVAIGDDLLSLLDRSGRLSSRVTVIDGDTAAVDFLAGEPLPALEAMKHGKQIPAAPF